MYLKCLLIIATMLRTSPMVFLLMVIAHTSAPAQDVIRPGSPAIGTGLIRDESFAMTWYAFRDTSRIPLGVIYSRTTVSKGLVTVVQEVKLNRATEPWVDSTVAVLQTLAPVYHASVNQQRAMALRFGKTVTGFYHDKVKNEKRDVNVETKDAYFDSNLYPNIVRWLPLKEGYQQSLRIFDYNPMAKMGELNATVSAVVPGMYASATSGNHTVWVVTVRDEIMEGAEIIYYIDQQSRALWKQELTIGPKRMAMIRVE